MTQRAGSQPQGAAASLLNGLNVLEAFTPAHPVLGVTEISERVGLHKSTVSRILQGFAEAGYVQRDEATGRYRLGLGMLGLAAPLLADLDVRRAAQPHLEELTSRTGETSALSLWNGTEAVVVEQVDSPHQVKHSAHIGTRYNLWASSSVRLFLSTIEMESVHDLVSSGHIIVSEQDRRRGGFEAPSEHLQHVRDSGLAVNDGQTTPEEFGVSTAIHDYRGSITGCITVSAPRSRVQDRDLGGLLMDSARDAAAAVSARLGCERRD